MNVARVVRRLARPYRRLSRFPTPWRLHLGCGRERWEGYINVDVDSRADSDVRADVRDLDRLFRPESVAEIVMIHALGYLHLWEAREFFAVAARVLVPGGRLVLELPDLSKGATEVLASQDDTPRYLEAVRGIFAFDIDWIERRHRFTPYVFGWSGWLLGRELTAAGFQRVESLAPQTHGPRPWRDIRVEAVK